MRTPRSLERRLASILGALQTNPRALREIVEALAGAADGDIERILADFSRRYLPIDLAKGQALAAFVVAATAAAEGVEGAPIERATDE